MIGCGSFDVSAGSFLVETLAIFNDCLAAQHGATHDRKLRKGATKLSPDPVAFEKKRKTGAAPCVKAVV